jgi:hypothetical protein
MDPCSPAVPSLTLRRPRRSRLDKECLRKLYEFHKQVLADSICHRSPSLAREHTSHPPTPADAVRRPLRCWGVPPPPARTDRTSPPGRGRVLARGGGGLVGKVEGREGLLVFQGSMEREVGDGGHAWDGAAAFGAAHGADPSAEGRLDLQQRRVRREARASEGGGADGGGTHTYLRRSLRREGRAG